VAGVEFTADGKQYTAVAGKEVILSCGTVQTPQLLELSGMHIPLSTVMNAEN